LHIFRKDARRFAYQIYALIILTLVWAWINIAQKRGDIPVNHYAGFAAAVLIMGWWYLVSLLIHEEPMDGDRQFWITRPYSRRSLATGGYRLECVNGHRMAQTRRTDGNRPEADRPTAGQL